MSKKQNVHIKIPIPPQVRVWSRQKMTDAEREEWRKIFVPEENRNSCCELCCNVFDRCEWSRYGKPVPGWIAARSEKTGIHSYKIYFCPKFDGRDISEIIPPKWWDFSGCVNLLCTIAGGAREAVDAALKNLMMAYGEYALARDKETRVRLDDARHRLHSALSVFGDDIQESVVLAAGKAVGVDKEMLRVLMPVGIKWTTA